MRSMVDWSIIAYKGSVFNLKLKMQNCFAYATEITATYNKYNVMPQLGKGLVGKYVRVTLTQLIGIYLWELPPCK